MVHLGNSHDSDLHDVRGIEVIQWACKPYISFQLMQLGYVQEAGLVCAAEANSRDACALIVRRPTGHAHSLLLQLQSTMQHARCQTQAIAVVHAHTYSKCDLAKLALWTWFGLFLVNSFCDSLFHWFVSLCGTASTKLSHPALENFDLKHAHVTCESNVMYGLVSHQTEHEVQVA